MRVLQVCQRYYPHIGGIEEHVKNISERLTKRFDVTVLTTDPSGKLPAEEIINKVQIKRFKSWAPGESYFVSWGLRNYLAEEACNFDVVHAHGYSALPALFAARAKRTNKLIFTSHYHGTGHTFFRSLLHIPYNFFGKKIFEAADRVVAVSNYEKNLVLKKFEIEPSKIVVIPNGVKREEFSSLKKAEESCRLTILYVGRLEKYKGVQYLVEVLPKMSEDTFLEIVGRGPYKQDLTSLIKKLCLEHRVRFSEGISRNELLQKYADASVFVLLSKHEAFGISVAEALCARTPCLVARTSALAEWIDDKNCIGIDYPIDVDKLAVLINSAIGRKVTDINVLDWNEVTDKVAALYS